MVRLHQVSDPTGLLHYVIMVHHQSVQLKKHRLYRSRSESGSCCLQHLRKLCQALRFETKKCTLLVFGDGPNGAAIYAATSL